MKKLKSRFSRARNATNYWDNGLIIRIMIWDGCLNICKKLFRMWDTFFTWDYKIFEHFACSLFKNGRNFHRFIKESIMSLKIQYHILFNNGGISDCGEIRTRESLCDMHGLIKLSRDSKYNKLSLWTSSIYSQLCSMEIFK